MKTLSLRDALLNAASELGQFAVMAQAIDDGLGAAVAEGSVPSPEINAVLQNVDLLRQSLEALGRFIEQAAVQVDPESTIDPDEAISGLTLRDLARTLTAAHQGGSRPVTAQVQGPGDASFF